MNQDSLRLFETESDYDSAKPDFVYPTVSYVKDIDEVKYMENPLATPLYIEALADGMTVTLDNNNLEYSTDQQVWTTLPMNTASPAINTGEKIYLRGNAVVGESGIGTFVISQSCNVGGNIMSLLFKDDFEGKTDLTGYNGAFRSLFLRQPVVNANRLILPATALADRCYSYMFEGCTSLTTPPALPATTLATECYYGMFNGCESLTTAPELPATTLAESCYNSMFQDCDSLTTAPALPATTLASSCYGWMFQSCKLLTTAPALPATTLTENCYNLMFLGCKNLNYIEMLATDISAEDCLTNWVGSVSTTGTFVKNPALSVDTIGRGGSGIPKGWTVVNV